MYLAKLWVPVAGWVLLQKSGSACPFPAISISEPFEISMIPLDSATCLRGVALILVGVGSSISTAAIFKS